MDFKSLLNKLDSMEAPAATPAAELDRLNARKIGPFVRKIGAGQGKVLQAGQVRPITGTQAQRSANVVSIAALRARVAEASEAAMQATVDMSKAKTADIDAATTRADTADRALDAAKAELEMALERSKTGPQLRKEAAEEAGLLAIEREAEG